MGEYKPEYTGEVVICQDDKGIEIFNLYDLETDYEFRLSSERTEIGDYVLIPDDGDAEGLIERLKKITFNGEILFDSPYMRDIREERRSEQLSDAEVKLRNGLEEMHYCNLNTEQYNSSLEDLAKYLLSLKEPEEE